MYELLFRPERGELSALQRSEGDKTQWAARRISAISGHFLESAIGLRELVEINMSCRCTHRKQVLDFGPFPIGVRVHCRGDRQARASCHGPARE